MTQACAFCGRNEGVFIDFAPPILCEECADIVITKLSSSAGSPPTADTAAVADKPTPIPTVTAATIPDPRSPNSPIDGATARVPHAHSHSVVSIPEVPATGSPAPAAAVAAVSVAAGAHELDIPLFLRRAKVLA